MVQVFGGTQTHGGSFSADGMTLQFGGSGGVGLLTQQISFTYSQALSTLYEIGSAQVYYVGGRATGNLSVSRIIGPSNLTQAFVAEFSDVCNPGTLELSAASGCGSQRAGQASYRMQDCVLTQLGGSLSAQNFVITETAQLTFLNMDVT